VHAEHRLAGGGQDLVRPAALAGSVPAIASGPAGALHEHQSLEQVWIDGGTRDRAVDGGAKGGDPVEVARARRGSWRTARGHCRWWPGRRSRPRGTAIGERVAGAGPVHDRRGRRAGEPPPPSPFTTTATTSTRRGRRPDGRVFVRSSAVARVAAPLRSGWAPELSRSGDTRRSGGVPWARGRKFRVGSNHPAVGYARALAGPRPLPFWPLCVTAPAAATLLL